MEKIFIDVEKELLEDVNDVLDSIGLDINVAVKMYLKRIARERSITFVLPKLVEKKQESEASVVSPDITNDNNNEKSYITKSIVVRMFKDRGHNIGKNVTYSSKNKSANNYWANPHFSVLDQEWYLILNDWIESKAYLFRIPAKEITANLLVPRNDKKDLIDLQIAYGDISFTDNRSDYSFKRYLIDTINY